ncbi:SDR family NAD(P)-dependent oxidoreductase [Paractinoplanes brasiliensis]|uniref:SDR family NAD(P)-dependent oxidoreductase n=1 Tax=Paractinoplanes brasiliensis TaxID=52695 RepID=UPI0010604183|nr:SDR family NAD(P)-dependent oxidoreductase [Actinoplanes brasiliensis]GID29900.1 hypothetical protein Abr02nite_48830 [Actinoplanes brasiliensis]
MPFQALQGRTVLLTGATGGLGRRIADALARSGVHLAVSGRNEASLRELAERYRQVRDNHTTLTVLGGCCGANTAHIDAISTARVAGAGG